MTKRKTPLPEDDGPWMNCADPILLQLCGPKVWREPGEEDDPPNIHASSPNDPHLDPDTEARR